MNLRSGRLSAGRHRAVVATCVVFAALLIGGCVTKTPRSEQHPTPTFSEPPMMYDDDQSRASYIVEEVWRGFDTLDTLNFSGPAQMNRFFADYLIYGGGASDEAFGHSLDRLVEISTPQVLVYVLGLSEHMYFHPNSPARSPRRYAQVARAALHSDKTPLADKVRLEEYLSIYERSKPGVIAPDFQYLTLQGKRSSLHKTPAELTLMLLYEPGCPACAEVEQILAQDASIGAWSKGVNAPLKMLFVYPNEDEALWRSEFQGIPSQAVVAWNDDGRILRESLYAMYATPSIYLFDAEKRIILSDADIMEVLEYLSNYFGAAPSSRS